MNGRSSRLNRRAVLGITATLPAMEALAQAPKPAAPKRPAVTEPPAPKVEPVTIWPGTLERLVGKYAFYQVASPGGLWESIELDRVRISLRQISLNEAPAEFRDRLKSAELEISDLRVPTTVDASQKLSPSKRGYIRFFEEEAIGKIVMRNIPGIGSMEDDKGEFTGTVTLQLLHQSHSNPSTSGIFEQRMRQELTWGAATLDYADLLATPVPADPKAEDEPMAVIANARILRSAAEVFAFVEYRDRIEGGDRHIWGAVRLMRPQVRREPAPAPDRKIAAVRNLSSPAI